LTRFSTPSRKKIVKNGNQQVCPTFFARSFSGYYRGALNLSFAFLSTLLALHILSSEDFSFGSDYCLNRGTKVSDHGLAALGYSLKALDSLTNLSLNFRYLKKKLLHPVFNAFARIFQRSFEFEWFFF
jgi:hypothetical protein